MASERWRSGLRPCALPALVWATRHRAETVADRLRSAHTISMRSRVPSAQLNGVALPDEADPRRWKARVQSISDHRRPAGVAECQQHGHSENGTKNDIRCLQRGVRWRWFSNCCAAASTAELVLYPVRQGLIHWLRFRFWDRRMDARKAKAPSPNRSVKQRGE